MFCSFVPSKTDFDKTLSILILDMDRSSIYFIELYFVPNLSKQNLIPNSFSLLIVDIVYSISTNAVDSDISRVIFSGLILFLLTISHIVSTTSVL